MEKESSVVQFNFEKIVDFLKGKDVEVSLEDESTLEVKFGSQVTLRFYNAPDSEESLIGLLGCKWHNHGVLMFSDAFGNYVELDYLEFLRNLESGEVLICSSFVDDKVVDRWPIHRKYFDELRFIRAEEELRIKRLKFS